jgi:Glycosyltransferase
MWNRAIHSLLQAQGLPHSFLVSERAAPDVLQSLDNAVAHFSFNFYRQVDESPTLEALESLVAHSFYMQRDMAALSERVTSRTLIFGHSLDAPSILGLALWHAALPLERRPCLALTIHFCFRMPTDATRACYRLAVRNFAPSSTVRFFVVADHIGAFLRSCAIRDVFSLPMLIEAGGARGSIDIPRRLVFGFTGEDRPERNVAILPEAIRQYIENGGTGDFLLHLSPSVQSDNAVKASLAALQTRYPERVRVFYGYMTPREYYSLFQEISVLLLPFPATLYHYFRPSQVLQEALAFGLPAIVCRGGFLEYESRKWDNGSLAIPDATAASLVNGMRVFEKDAQVRCAKGVEAGKRYRSVNTPDNFWQSILAAFE